MLRSLVGVKIEGKDPKVASSQALGAEAVKLEEGLHGSGSGSGMMLRKRADYRTP